MPLLITIYHTLQLLAADTRLIQNWPARSILDHAYLTASPTLKPKFIERTWKRGSMGRSVSQCIARAHRQHDTRHLKGVCGPHTVLRRIHPPAILDPTLSFIKSSLVKRKGLTIDMSADVIDAVAARMYRMKVSPAHLPIPWM